MKYKTQIVQENNNFIGYAMVNEDVVYTTNLHPDPVMVTRELTRFISSNSPSLPTLPTKPPVKSASQVNLASKAFPVRSSTSANPSLPDIKEPTSAPYTPVTNLPQRKCCGRG